MAVDRLAAEFEITYRCRGCDESAPDWKAIVHLGGCEAPLIVEGGPIETDRDELVRRLAKVRERAIWLPTAEWPNCVQHYGGDVAIPHCHLCAGEWQPTCSEVHEPPDCPAAPMEEAK